MCGRRPSLFTLPQWVSLGHCSSFASVTCSLLLRCVYITYLSYVPSGVKDVLNIMQVKSSGARVGFINRRRSERKVTRMVVVIVVVFVLCWLPFYIINMVNLVVIIPESSVTAGIYFFAVVLSYANSCANPLLYGFLSDNFKQSFRKVSWKSSSLKTKPQNWWSSRSCQAMLCNSQTFFSSCLCCFHYSPRFLLYFVGLCALSLVKVLVFQSHLRLSIVTPAFLYSLPSSDDSRVSSFGKFHFQLVWIIKEMQHILWH